MKLWGKDRILNSPREENHKHDDFFKIKDRRTSLIYIGQKKLMSSTKKFTMHLPTKSLMLKHRTV